MAVASVLALGACGEDSAAPDANVRTTLDAATHVVISDAKALALVEEAEAANDMGRTSAARDMLAQAQDLFAAVGDTNGLGAVELVRANLESYLGQSDAARTAFALALDHYRTAGNLEGEAIALAALGDLEKSTFRYAEARQAFTEAREAYQRAGRPLGAKHVLLGLERVAEPDKPEAQARRDIDEAFLIYQKIGDPAGLGLVSEVTAALEERLEHYSMAYTHYRDAAISYSLAERPRDFARVQLHLGVLETGQGFPLTARDALTLALQGYREISDDSGAALTLAAIGRLERVVGRPAESRASYRDAADLFAIAGDDLSAITAKLGAAEAARVLQDDPSAAEEAYRSILAVLEPGGPPNLLADANLGLGMLTLAGPNAPDAAAPFQAAIAGYASAGDRLGEARAHLGLAATLQEAGQTTLVAAEAEAALILFADSGNAVGVALALTVTAKASPDQEDRLYGEATAHLTAAEDPLRDANQLLGLGIFGELFTRTGDEGEEIGYEEVAPPPLDAPAPEPHEEIWLTYPNANREAVNLLGELRAQIGMK